MSSRICLNCTNTVEHPEEEFCRRCQEDLDEMVDANDMDSRNEVDMADNYNPFFGSASMTGGIRSKSNQNVEGMIDDEGGASFLRSLLGIATILFVMILYYMFRLNA